MCIVHFTGIHKPWDRTASFVMKSLVRPLRHMRRPPTRTSCSILYNYLRILKEIRARMSDRQRTRRNSSVENPPRH